MVRPNKDTVYLRNLSRFLEFSWFLFLGCFDNVEPSSLFLFTVSIINNSHFHLAWYLLNFSVFYGLI